MGLHANNREEVPSAAVFEDLGKVMSTPRVPNSEFFHINRSMDVGLKTERERTGEPPRTRDRSLLKDRFAQTRCEELLYTKPEFGTNRSPKRSDFVISESYRPLKKRIKPRVLLPTQIKDSISLQMMNLDINQQKLLKNKEYIQKLDKSNPNQESVEAL